MLVSRGDIRTPPDDRSVQTGQEMTTSRVSNRGGEVPYSDIQAAPFTIWKHVRTNSLYVVLGIAYDSTNRENEPENERYVVYVSQTTGLMRVREISEFLDGRFAPMGFDASNVYPAMETCDNGSNQCQIRMLLPDGRNVQCTMKHGHQGMHNRGVL